MSGRRPKVGLILPLFSGDSAKVIAAARDAEGLGFDGVFGFDHFFPPGGAVDDASLEVFSTLGAVGASTSRVSIGTLVTRAGLRPAGMVAKMASTLDLISGGRMILAIGSGDSIDRPEHDAFGFASPDIEERRDQLRETVAAVRALFRGEAYAGGRHVPATAGPLLPSSVRPGGPPVWIGGASNEAVRMAATGAEAWNGWGMQPDRFARKARLLREEAAALSRAVDATWAGVVVVGEDESEAAAMSADRLERGITGDAFSGSAARFAEFLHQLAADGATWAILLLAGSADRRRLVAERVIGAPTFGS